MNHVTTRLILGVTPSVRELYVRSQSNSIKRRYRVNNVGRGWKKITESTKRVN